MYKDLDERLIGAAQQSIFAHIIDLSNRGIIKPQDEISIDSEFYRI